MLNTKIIAERATIAQFSTFKYGFKFLITNNYVEFITIRGPLKTIATLQKGVRTIAYGPSMGWTRCYELDYRSANPSRENRNFSLSAEGI